MRERLFARLDEGVRGPVTLVSAPAGSGKTMLVASWLRDAGPAGSSAWVTVRRGERDASRFWASVLASLRACPDIARAGALETLTPSPSAVGSEFVHRLAEGLGELERPVVLVVDDLHQLEAQEPLDALAALRELGPPQLRLVLITRRDPQLELHRLRVSGELTEIRAPDLEFTPEEAAELLAAAPVEISESSVRLLCDRTAGWAAGLRLAALALPGQDDPEAFVAEFSGSERTVADYLMAEVLATHPPETRRMLLRTSVLEHVNGPLVEALGGRDGERLLRELEDANAFVESVDVGRSWFRYHPLLSDFLRAQLRAEAPHELEGLHRAAARWLGDNGFAVQAIRHAQAAHDWDHAVELLIESWFSLFLDGRRITIHGLLAALPLKVLRSDAELATLVAADHIADGRLEDADAYLELAGRLAPKLDERRRRRFEITRAVVALMCARSRGDFEAAAESAHAIFAPADGQSWADVVPNEDLRALALVNLGSVELWALRVEEAEAHLLEGLTLAREIGRPYVVLNCYGPLTEVALMLHRQAVAEQRALEALAFAETHGWSDSPMAGFAYAALGGFLLSAGRIDEGEVALERAEQRLDGTRELQANVTLRFRWGWLRFVQGRYQEARDCFDAADRMHAHLSAPHYLATLSRAWRLRADIRLGEVDSARSLLADTLEADRATVEWCNVAAELHLAEDDPAAAVEALAPVLDGTAEGFHYTFQIEALFMAAVAHDRLGDHEAADRALERGLDLADPDGYMGIVLTVPGARSLLERRRRFGTTHPQLVAGMLDGLAGTAAPDRHGDLPERLSDRELTVLQFLTTNLSAAAIASELVVSVHTVKTHMRHVYRKLGVHTRSEAVERARALGLLASSVSVR